MLLLLRPNQTCHVRTMGGAFRWLRLWDTFVIAPLVFAANDEFALTMRVVSADEDEDTVGQPNEVSFFQELSEDPVCEGSPVKMTENALPLSEIAAGTAEFFGDEIFVV